MIDERAIVDSSVVVGENVSIGPWTIIGPNVVLGDNVQIASSVVVKGPCHIGAGAKIYQFATVGEDTPALAYAGEFSELTIGANTIIREGVTIHRGMAAGGISKTVVGENCLLMAYVHIGHDCIVGDNVIMANNASLAGHVVVGDYANFGGYAGIPQFRQIGAHTHIAGMSLVTKDVPAFMTVAGNPANAIGLNLEGINRRGFSDEAIQAVKAAYRVVYRSSKKLQEAIVELDYSRKLHPEVDVFVKSLESSDKGIIRGKGE